MSNLVNISIDDVSPHPLSSTKVLDQCFELIKYFPDIKFTLFVPAAYWRTMRKDIATKEPLRIDMFPYFSKYPKLFIEKCLSILKPGGIALLDWGLGDHWRFDNYKVGWVKNDEHEFAYQDNNFLWSTIWHDSFLENSQFLTFQNNVKKFGYKNVKDAVNDEVPAVFNLSNLQVERFQVGLMTLWEDLPQLYICLLVENK